MPQPPAYVPQTDFAVEEADNVGGRSTSRTAALDTEFTALAASVSAILTNLALNQRDDGEIRDGRVKLHTIASDVLALLTTYGAIPRGAWTTATVYALKDLVSQGGNTYIATTAHTSGVFATDLAAGKWLLFSLSATPSATSVTFTPTATLAATTVQGAIDEADTENRALSAAVAASVAALNTSSGSNSVGFIQTGTGAVARKTQDKLRERVSAEDFGAIGDGVADDTAALNLCAALGRTVLLKPGSSYLISSRVTGVTGTRFVCADGVADVVFKTSGGYVSTDLTADKDAAARCGFLFLSTDDNAMEGIRFRPDTAYPACVIYPIRVRGGQATKGCAFSRIEFKNFSICNGGFLSLNSIGAGSYKVRDIWGHDCGTSSTSWTGTPQITVFEIDNDMISSTPSVPGYFENIRGENLAFSGAALTLYGQQSDVVNIAGISGSGRKGPVGYGIYGDNVGEVLDIFCQHAVIKGIRARAAYNYGVKLIHGAAYNQIECDSIESFGQAAVTIAGSASIAAHTMHNSVRVGVIRQSAAIGGFANRSAVLFQDNSGTSGTCLPKNNVVRVDKIIGDSTNMVNAVRDGGAANTNGNLVEVGQGSGWTGASTSIGNPSNVRVRWLDNTDVFMRMPSNQIVTTAVQTTVNFSTTVRDVNSEYTSGGVIRGKYPGKKAVSATIRWQANAVGDEVLLQLYKNTTIIGSTIRRAAQNAQPETYTVATTDYLGEDEVNAATADYSVKATITAGGTVTILATTGYTQFQVVGV